MTKLDDIMWKLNLTNKKLAKLSRVNIKKIANALGVNANQIGD